MNNIRIFDDQYWWIIYKKLNTLLPKYNYPIKKNVISPIPFINKIQNWDIILLDNYFPWETREESLGDIFLEKYIEKWLSCKIICISDYWKVLLNKYSSWEKVDKKWDIVWYIPSKDSEEILKLLK